MTMLSKADNEQLCRVGPGTPMGEVFRRYWSPICMAEQAPAVDGAPARIEMLGEELVLFRASDGRLGLLDEGCLHRGASLALGRVEDSGIRCLYHGRKFDVDGALLDTPNHPDPRLRQRLSATAYRVREAPVNDTRTVTFGATYRHDGGPIDKWRLNEISGRHNPTLMCPETYEYKGTWDNLFAQRRDSARRVAAGGDPIGVDADVSCIVACDENTPRDAPRQRLVPSHCAAPRPVATSEEV
jgi:nitrite reductase/ring-hydroxylating ferredoxin subunit